MKIEFRSALDPKDREFIRSLIRTSNLVTEGLEHVRHLYVLFVDGERSGCAGLSLYGTCALLRSVAVVEMKRGMGLGEYLVNRTGYVAHTLGADRIYLLTTTAGMFFERLGFQPCDRTQVPEAVKEDVEFRSACPASARLYTASARRHIVCLGDSITEGYPWGPGASWPALVAGMRGLPMLNMGVCGELSKEVLKRAEVCLRRRPDYAVFCAGTNDAYMGLTASDILENYRRFIVLCRRMDVCCVLATPTPVFDAGPDRVIHDVADAVRRLAAREGTGLLDFNRLLTRRHVPDAVHPSSEGYMLMARAVERTTFPFRQR
ncbi:MAG: GNAT family N-acetyltransferase [Bacillota bacterium]